MAMTQPTKDPGNTPKKKLRMELHFGADQTPTPTRFIRNCEEVGLFQDLQNVNPFEETFRKAVESGKTGSTALQNCRLSTQFVTDDTLHTPHVFPHIIENDSVSKPVESSLKTKSGIKHGQPDEWERARPAVTVVRQEADTSQLKPIAPCLSVKSMEPAPPVQLILEMPDGRLMQLNATPFEPAHGSNDLLTRVDKSKLEMGSVILHTSPKKKQEYDISPLIKEKLKARLGNAGANCHMNNQNRTGYHERQNEEAIRNKRTSSISNTSNSDDDEEVKRKRFLERNRAAAMRCREKRKCWVATLEQRAEQLVNQNQQLQFDLGAVRAENAQLKTLLLAHKDCSVTRIMNNNLLGPIGMEPLVVKPERIIKPLSPDETEFRQKLKMKLKRASIKKGDSQNCVQGNIKVEPLKIKRLSLDIETAKQAQCQKDTYLSSALLANETLELESFKPVATQVIQVNPNALNRHLSSPNIEGPLLPISPNTDSMDYT